MQAINTIASIRKAPQTERYLKRGRLMAAALCHFPSSPSHRPLSKLLSNSRSQSLLPTKDLISNTSPNFACGYHPRPWSSSLSVTASTTAFAPPEHSESTSLGDITRLDFPILRQKVNGHDLVYMDSGATSQKPNYVLNSLREYYESSNSNVHRGVHYLSQKATTAYENAREKVAKFINSSDHREIVFTRNATEAINLVANSWGDVNLKSGDEILLTVAEHHSCIVPWQIVAQKKGAILKYIGLTSDEVPDIEQLKKALSKKTKIVVSHHVSNTLGSVLPIEDIISWSHDVGAKVLVDACQSAPHMVVDVQKLDADFLVASSHKMCGPTGIGFLYGKINLLSSMPPFLGGGEMIADVFQDYSTYAEPPLRFEAGTPAIAEAVGLGAAIEYLSGIGMKQIHDYERELAEYLYYSLTSIPNVRVYGPAPSEVTHRAALCSFNVENIHPTDIATILNEEHGVAIRSGHHCAQPLHRYLGVNASARASLYFYNTKAEVDLFIEALKSTISFFNPFGDSMMSSPLNCVDGISGFGALH